MSIQIPAPATQRTAPARDSSSVAKAGPVGPGAGVLMTEYTLPTVLGQDPNQRMQKYMKLGTEVDWVRAAERIIGGRISSCAWHLEDPDGDRIDEDWDGSPLALELVNVLENPQADLPLIGPDGVGRRQSRRQQVILTSRHMGVAGNSAWFFDRLDGNNAPHAILYIRPDRLTPAVNKAGVLTGWVLDKRPGDPGIPLPLEQVRLFQLTPPDVGIWGPGLIESSMAKAINNGLVDRHYTALLSAGGRISGILSPKEGAITDDNVYQQMVRDWRNVTEQPESARRLQIVRAPVEFTSTVQSVGEMQIIDLMYHNRDALLALWGVPLSMLGGSVSSGGLNSGDSRKYDEAALWQGAVQDRLTEFAEGYQSICDQWESAIGFAPKFVWDPPEFDDELPNFEKLAKAATTPLRNKERRAIIGLDPFNDPLLDNAIWMPSTIVAMAMGTDEETGKIPEGDIPGEKEPPPAPVIMGPPDPDNPTPPGVGKPPAGTPPGKPPAPGQQPPAPPGARAAVKGRLSDIRDEWDSRVTPKLRDAVAEFLREQRDTLVERVVKNWDAIARHRGTDESMWLPDLGKWDSRLMDTLRPALQGMAAAVEEDITANFERGKKADTQARAYALGDADTGAVMHVLTRGAGKVTNINEYTRAGLRVLIGKAIEDGLSPREAGDLVEAWSGFDEYRAERIARTEMMFAYNQAALHTYGEYGVTHVEAIDGDEDEECAARNGQVYPITEAQNIDDHPNGTLDWVPV